MRQNQNDGHLGFETLEDRLLLSTIVALVDTDAAAGVQPGVVVLGSAGNDTIETGTLAGDLAIYDAAGLLAFDVTTGVVVPIAAPGGLVTAITPTAILLDVLAGSANNGAPVQFALGAGDDTLNVGSASILGPAGAIDFGNSDVLIAGNAGTDTANVDGSTFHDLTLQDSSGTLTQNFLQNTVDPLVPNFSDGYTEGGGDAGWVSDSIINGNLGVGIGDAGTDDGADSLLLDGLTTHGRVDVYTGAGDDTIVGVDNAFGGPVLIDSGVGNDMLIGSGDVHTGLAHFSTGDGDDVIAYAGNTYNGGNVTMGGAGHDTLAQAGSADTVAGPAVSGFEVDTDITAAMHTAYGPTVDLDLLDTTSIEGLGGAAATAGILHALIDPLV